MVGRLHGHVVGGSGMRCRVSLAGLTGCGALWAPRSAQAAARDKHRDEVLARGASSRRGRSSACHMTRNTVRDRAGAHKPARITRTSGDAAADLPDGKGKQQRGQGHEQTGLDVLEQPEPAAGLVGLRVVRAYTVLRAWALRPARRRGRGLGQAAGRRARPRPRPAQRHGVRRDKLARSGVDALAHHPVVVRRVGQHGAEDREPAKVPRATANSVYATGTMPCTSKKSQDSRLETEWFSGMNHQLSSSAYAVATATALAPTSPNLTIAQRSRLSPWVQTRRWVPCSTSRATSAPTKNIPTSSGRKTKSAPRKAKFSYLLLNCCSCGRQAELSTGMSSDLPSLCRQSARPGSTYARCICRPVGTISAASTASPRTVKSSCLRCWRQVSQIISVPPYRCGSGRAARPRTPRRGRPAPGPRV